MHAAWVALVAAALAGCQTVPAPDAARSAVSAATEQWIAAFNRCDAIGATSLYAGEPVLWGTTSPSIITSSAGVRQYFERVCAAPRKPNVLLGEQHVRVYGDTAVNSGTYTFIVSAGSADQVRQLPARFSFTYRNVDGRWLIVDHHSSALPSTPTPAPAMPVK